MKYSEWRSQTLKQQRYSRLITRLLFGMVERGTRLRYYTAKDLRLKRSQLIESKNKGN